jgi:hypothetical protein
MLQTIKDFAREELLASGQADEVALRHAVHFGQVAEEIRTGIEGNDQVRSIERGVIEDGDLQAGLDFLLRRARDGDGVSAELGMHMCGSLWLYWHIRSKHLSARDYVRGFLGTAPDPGPTIGRSNALRTAGLASWSLGHFEEAIGQGLESYRIAQDLDAATEMALAAGLLVIFYLTVDLERAVEWSREAIDRSRAQTYPLALGFALSFAGMVNAVSGDTATAARRFFFDSAAAYLDVGSVRGVGTSVIGLAAVETAEGRALRAVQIAAAAEVFALEEGIMNVYSEDDPGREYVERAKSELGTSDLESATGIGRALSVKEALDLARDVVPAVRSS